MATKYNPFEEMTRMFDEMHNAVWNAEGGLWDDRSATGGLPVGGLPAGRFGQTNLDLTKHEGEFVLSADLPEFETEEITLSFDDGVLTIIAEHEEDGETVSQSRTVHEQVTVPATIGEEAIEAAYHNGVLTVQMPILADLEESGHVIGIED